jgi:transposase
MAREYERAMAARLCRNGMGQKEAAQELGKSYQWVRKWVKREREESGFKDVPRSGRPRKNPRGDPKSNY